MGFCSKIKQRRILSAVNPKLQYWVFDFEFVILDGLDFEVETNERKYQTFQILLWFFYFATCQNPGIFMCKI